MSDEKRSDAAREMGRSRTEKKALASRKNGVLGGEFGRLGGRPEKPLSELACTCGRGLAMEGHPTTCPRGRAIRRRAAKADANSAPTTNS